MENEDKVSSISKSRLLSPGGIAPNSSMTNISTSKLGKSNEKRESKEDFLNVKSIEIEDNSFFKSGRRRRQESKRNTVSDQFNISTLSYEQSVRYYKKLKTDFEQMTSLNPQKSIKALEEENKRLYKIYTSLSELFEKKFKTEDDNEIQENEEEKAEKIVQNIAKINFEIRKYQNDIKKYSSSTNYIDQMIISSPRQRKKKEQEYDKLGKNFDEIKLKYQKILIGISKKMNMVQSLETEINELEQKKLKLERINEKYQAFPKNQKKSVFFSNLIELRKKLRIFSGDGNINSRKYKTEYEKNEHTLIQQRKKIVELQNIQNSKLLEGDSYKMRLQELYNSIFQNQNNQAIRTASLSIDKKNSEKNSNQIRLYEVKKTEERERKRKPKLEINFKGNSLNESKITINSSYKGPFYNRNSNEPDGFLNTSELNKSKKKDQKVDQDLENLFDRRKEPQVLQEEKKEKNNPSFLDPELLSKQSDQTNSNQNASNSEKDYSKNKEEEENESQSQRENKEQSQETTPKSSNKINENVSVHKPFNEFEDLEELVL